MRELGVPASVGIAEEVTMLERGSTSGRRTPRVLLVEDHPLMRRGVRELLENRVGWEVAGEAATGAEALALADETRPDLVLCDFNLPDADAVAITRHLLARHPGTRVVILTVHADDEHRRQALAAGALAVVGKDWPPADLIALLRRVLAGEPPEPVRRGTDRLVAPADRAEAVRPPLTPREIEVLAEMARGNSNKEIARDLGLSDQTVKNHITAILRKTETGHRTEAVLLGLRRGWIGMEDAGATGGAR